MSLKRLADDCVDVFLVLDDGLCDDLSLDAGDGVTINFLAFWSRLAIKVVAFLLLLFLESLFCLETLFFVSSIHVL